MGQSNEPQHSESMYPQPDTTPLFKDPSKDYLNLSYQELKDRNLKIRERVEKDDPEDIALLEKEIRDKLKGEDSIKAVTIYWTDLNGKLHHTDFDKDHLLESGDNLTFDGSSIRGFSTIDNSDLRFSIDWSSFRYPPADVFGKGKVIVFANIMNQDGTPFEGDIRNKLKQELVKLKKEEGIKVNVAPEVEGMLVEGRHAEQRFKETKGMKLASEGGYCDALPQDELKRFNDKLAEATRAMGFRNEKDHPEVAPGQFELTYKYRSAAHAADQILLYKLTARQIAAKMGLTATFLPKPVEDVNGNGMHLNISVERNGENLFYDAEGPNQLAEKARMFIAGVLRRAEEGALAQISTANANRRNDEKFEAPTAIRASGSDRSSMIRIPAGNKNSARMEVRSVAPDANPHLAILMLIRAGMEGVLAKDTEKQELAKLLDNNRPIKHLPPTFHDGIEAFEKSEFTKRVMGANAKANYVKLKREEADRTPRAKGNRIKNSEIWFHPEVTNQVLWNKF